MHISVIGLGYMGLPMAAILARAGHQVTGVDINPATVAAVNQGKCPFSEPGMPELITEAHQSGRLQAVTTPQPADCFILSLPTPVDHTTHLADMSFVEAGARSIAPVLQPGNLVVLESTSPLGATHTNCRAVIEALRPELTNQIDYVFCPERAIPGNTLHEMVHNDRLVGGLTPAATQRGIDLYQTFSKGKLLPTTAPEAELVKLVENASRDAQIAFANELSLVCQHLGLDVWRIINLANHHPRVNILQPGAGVGGHCIAVDPWFIVQAAPHLTPLLQTVRQVNDKKPKWVADKVTNLAQQLKQNGQKITVACLGLAYKPNVDDLRESPSITVVEALQNEPSLQLKVVEPHLTKWQQPLSPLDEAVKQADIIVTLTAHQAFQALSAGALQGKHVIDVAGIYRDRTDGIRII